jgi:hypothetical protein
MVTWQRKIHLIFLIELEMNNENKNGNEERHITGDRRIAIKMVWPRHPNGGLLNY